MRKYDRFRSQSRHRKLCELGVLPLPQAAIDDARLSQRVECVLAELTKNVVRDILLAFKSQEFSQASPAVQDAMIEVELRERLSIVGERLSPKTFETLLAQRHPGHAMLGHVDVAGRNREQDYIWGRPAADKIARNVNGMVPYAGVNEIGLVRLVGAIL